MDTIGEILKNARLARGLTIEELQQLTKIQRRHLEALEKNDFDALPGTYYSRTFIRQYANEVGVDGEYLVNRFDGQPVKETQAPEVVRGSRSELYKGNHRGNSWKDRLPVILLAIVAILIVVGVAFLTLKEDNRQPIIKEATDLTVEENIEESTKKSTQTTKESEPEKTIETTTEEKKEELIIDFESETGENLNYRLTNVPEKLELTFEGINGPCWIGVLIDGVYHYEHTLQVGEKETTELPSNTKNAIVVLGASSNVKMKANGEEFDFNPNQTHTIKRNLQLAITYQE